jgi:ABC-type spermidine/putrescine transport system permease subunit I
MARSPALPASREESDIATSITSARIRGSWGWFVLPGLVFLFIFFMWPLGVMFVRSLTDPSSGLENYRRVATSPLIFKSLVTTGRTALLTTIVALLVGYPYAYLIYVSPPRLAAVFQLAVLIPSWLSFVVRTYALTVLLRDTGVINETLIKLGLIQNPLPLIRNDFAITVGMTVVLLPYMVLPLYAVMRRIDPDLSRAAAILGEPPLRSFVRVFLPLSVPGILAGSLLVFVLGLGFYITPAMLGNDQGVYVSQQVVFEVQHLEWGYGSAIAATLLVVTGALLLGASFFVRLGDVFGIGAGE